MSANDSKPFLPHDWDQATKMHETLTLKEELWIE